MAVVVCINAMFNTHTDTPLKSHGKKLSWKWKRCRGKRRGNREACTVMDSCYGKSHMEKVSWNAWVSWKAASVECHGKAVMESVTETVRHAPTWTRVIDRCHGTHDPHSVIHIASPTHRHPHTVNKHAVNRMPSPTSITHTSSPAHRHPHGHARCVT